MLTFLLGSAGLVWWFIGLVSVQLIWKSMSNEQGAPRYEWGPFVATGLFLLSFTGPIAGYLCTSRLAANRIHSRVSKDKMLAAVRADRERLLNRIYEKALKDDMDIAEIGQLRVEDLELESELPTLN